MSKRVALCYSFFMPIYGKKEVHFIALKDKFYKGKELYFFHWKEKTQRKLSNISAHKKRFGDGKVEYVLYIDRIWLLYFSLHVFLYGLTGKQLHRKVSISRILMVSACNGVTFLVLLFIPGVTVPLKMLIQVGILDLLFCQLIFSFLTKEIYLNQLFFLQKQNFW